MTTPIISAAIAAALISASAEVPPMSIAGVRCQTQIARNAGKGICFDFLGDLGARGIVVEASRAQLAGCGLVIVSDAHGRPAACLAADDSLILAGNVSTLVARGALDEHQPGMVCIAGSPAGPERIDPSVACFTGGGDLLLAGSAFEVER